MPRNGVQQGAVMFEIKQWNPETYRRQTRRSTLIIALIFVLLAVTLSSVAVMLFGEADGDNFRLNLGGVIAGPVSYTHLTLPTIYSV